MLVVEGQKIWVSWKVWKISTVLHRGLEVHDRNQDSLGPVKSIVTKF